MFPVHIAKDLFEYAETGHIANEFTCALVCGDLLETVIQAKNIGLTLECLDDVVQFMLTQLPASCFGSPDIMFSYVSKPYLDWPERANYAKTGYGSGYEEIWL